MPSFTVRVVLRTDKENKKGLCPISLCVTIGGKRSYHSTGLSINQAQWDSKKTRMKQAAENGQAYNAKISREVARVERELLAADEKGTLSHNTGKASARPKSNFYEFAEALFKEQRDSGHAEAARRNENNIPSIKVYSGDNLSLSDINFDWLKGYEKHCRNEILPRRMKENEKKLANNSVWTRFKTLRKLLLAAEKEGRIDECPIGESRGGYPMPKYKNTPKDYLLLSEVEKFFDLINKGGLTRSEDIILNFFLVECTSGIRHSDWSRFETEIISKTKSLRVRTKKTGEPVYVPITPGGLMERAINRIEANGYTYSGTETANPNKVLKILAKAAGIPKHITTHTGRHTCATLLLEKGYSRETVAEVLGVSMRVIDVYAKMTRLKVKTEFERLGGL